MAKHGGTKKTKRKVPQTDNTGMGQEKQDAREEHGRPRSEEVGETQIVAVLPTLPKDSVERIASACRLILAGALDPADGAKDESSERFFVYKSLYDSIMRLGVKHPPPEFHQFKHLHKRHVTPFNAAADTLISFVAAAFTPKHKLERMKAYRLCFDVLRDQLRAEGESIGVVSLIGQMNLIPSLIDNAFPGYAEAGLLPHLLGKTRKK